MFHLHENMRLINWILLLLPLWCINGDFSIDTWLIINHFVNYIHGLACFFTLRKIVNLSVNIVVSNLRPDMTLLDREGRKIILGELTVPWEESIGKTQQRKLNRFEELSVQIGERGWKPVEVTPFKVEVGCRGFPAVSVGRFPKVSGVEGEWCGDGRERERRKAVPGFYGPVRNRKRLLQTHYHERYWD